jgi:hypothetical protein
LSWHAGVNVAPSVINTVLFGVPTCTRPFLTLRQTDCATILPSYASSQSRCAENVRAICWDRWRLKVTYSVALPDNLIRCPLEVAIWCCRVKTSSESKRYYSLLFMKIVSPYVLGISLIDRLD